MLVWPIRMLNVACQRTLGDYAELRFLPANDMRNGPGKIESVPLATWHPRQKTKQHAVSGNAFMD
jgi:hypothetical protein